MNEIKKTMKDENIVFYMIERKKIDCFVSNLFTPAFDFVFPLNACDPYEYLTIKKYFMIYAHFVSCSSRRRTKNALAHPFDSHDQHLCS